MSIHQVSIYRSDYDSTNNGVTSPENAFGRDFYMVTREDEVTQVPRRIGPPPIVLVLKTKNIGGEPYKYLVPSHVDTVRRSCMFGGNFVWSSDSRFRDISEQPLPVHDRFE